MPLYDFKCMNNTCQSLEKIETELVNFSNYTPICKDCQEPMVKIENYVCHGKVIGGTPKFHK